MKTIIIYTTYRKTTNIHICTSRHVHTLNTWMLETVGCIKQQALEKGSLLPDVLNPERNYQNMHGSIYSVQEQSSYHGNDVEGYAPMFPAIRLSLTLPLPASNVCSHGDRLFHLVNMMWHVSSCTSQEMTGDWFILRPTQTMNDDTVKKHPKEPISEKVSKRHVLHIKQKNLPLKNTPALLSEASTWLIILTINGQTSDYLITFWGTLASVCDIVCNREQVKHLLHVCGFFISSWFSEKPPYLRRPANKIEACVRRISHNGF